MTKLTAVTPALAGFAVLTFSLITGAAPAAAFEARTGQLQSAVAPWTSIHCLACALCPTGAGRWPPSASQRM